MINVTNEYRKAIMQNRQFEVDLKMVFPDGTEKHMDNGKLFAFGVKDSVSSSSSFDIGSAIMNQLDIKIDNTNEEFDDYDFEGAVIRPKVGLKLQSGVTEWLNKGVYTAEPGNFSGTVITVKANDNMARFDCPYTLSNLTYPATLGAIVRDACGCCGVSLAADSAAFEMSDYVVDTRPDDKSTFREILSYVGEISCHWCRCNANGQLSLGWYDMSVLENEDDLDGGKLDGDKPYSTGDAADGGNFTGYNSGDDYDGGDFKSLSKFHQIHSLSSMDVCTDDVVITGIRVVETAPGDSEADDIAYQAGEDGYVLAIEGNKLIQGGKGEQVASYLGGRLIGMTFRPFSVSCLSDPAMEAGDCAYVVDRKGNRYRTVITNTTFQAGNYQKVSCGAESPARNSATRYSKATQAYRALRRQVNRNKTEWEKAMEDMGTRLEESSGLYSTIGTQEDGSKIYYLHDKPVLKESAIVWKMTAEAWGVSTDGGGTWNGGMTVDGDVVARILNTIGLNADWINTGALEVKDSAGDILFRADIDSGRVDIVADSFSLRGKTIGELARDELSDFVDAVYGPDIEGLQAQVDGQIESYYYDYEPSLQNHPASEWADTATRQKHEGDVFYWKSKGYAYRFLLDGATWKWQLIQDADITKAIASAEKAQDTADGKRRVFVATPQPPYDIGDLWAQGSTGDMMRCRVPRSTGAYVSTDWEPASKYVGMDKVDGAITEYDISLGQGEVFNKLTNGGEWQGIFVEDGQMYINASYILAGILAGKFINAKGISVKDSSNNTTFHIDDAGNVTVRAKAFSLSGQTIGDIAYGYAGSALDSANAYTDSRVANIKPNMSQQEIFGILTNNGQTQGIYLSGGKIYVNGEYLKSNSITSDKISVNDLYALDATIGGWIVNSTYIQSNDGNVRLYSDGRVVIGLATLSGESKAFTVKYGLHVYAGTSQFSDGSDQIKFFNLTHVSSGGHLVFASDGSTLAYSSSSSKRYKNHVRDMEPEDVDALYDLPIIYFKYKDGYLDENDRLSGRQIPGFYAEDMERLYPDGARYNSEGLVEDWNERTLIPAMLELIQEQHKEIDALRESQASIGQRTAKLESLIGGGGIGD